MKTGLRILIFTATILFLSATAFTQPKAEEPKLERTSIDLNDPEYLNLTFDDILAKYHGKVIYLDFWASWCGPCKREMPHSQELQETFYNKDVVFVYMSSDKTAGPWVAAMDKLNLTGEHYRASYDVKMDYAKRFNLRFIPRYVLIDKKGNVAYDNAKRPSDPNVVKDIEDLL
ncbi:MAG: hypothetical protein DRJ02_01785 [Bacteroidetes bacterium]|nr:MAG: hypothetical protein DRJ02_01785 [Bacteroidota bacterium]